MRYRRPSLHQISVQKSSSIKTDFTSIPIPKNEESPLTNANKISLRPQVVKIKMTFLTTKHQACQSNRKIYWEGTWRKMLKSPSHKKSRTRTCHRRSRYGISQRTFQSIFWLHCSMKKKKSKLLRASRTSILRYGLNILRSISLVATMKSSSTAKKKSNKQTPSRRKRSSSSPSSPCITGNDKTPRNSWTKTS